MWWFYVLNELIWWLYIPTEVLLWCSWWGREAFKILFKVKSILKAKGNFLGSMGNPLLNTIPHPIMILVDKDILPA